MIFVTLGSQKFQFNRLLKEIDKLVKDGTIKEEVFAQIGYSNYQPQYYKYKQFLSREEFNNYEEKADIIITHGGTGAIIGAVKKEKKVIAVPRLSKYEEHVDDHQLQLIEQFTEMKLIVPCFDIADLKEAYYKVQMMDLMKYQSNTEKYLVDLENFLEN